MEAQDQRAVTTGPGIPDARRQPRFKLQVEIRINSRTCGLVAGHTVDISESGISAMLKFELPVGELVELQFILPFGAVTVYATVRQHNAFRYGLQFVESHPAQQIIRATCRTLKLEQSVFGETK